MSEIPSPRVALSDAAPAERNSAGAVGLVLSIVGLFTLGVLSPIALVVNLVGLFKRANTKTVVGLVLSGVGCVLLLVTGAVVVMGLYFLEYHRQIDQIRIDVGRDAVRKNEVRIQEFEERLQPPSDEPALVPEAPPAPVDVAPPAEAPPAAPAPGD